jgi:hypothetical protein
MADAARSLYESLANAAGIGKLVGHPEDLHLEVKECGAPLTDRLKGYVSQALSGFGNSDGGVLVLGLSTKRDHPEEPDVVTRVKPFEKYETAASEIRALVGDAVTPLVDGVLVDAVPSERGGGFGYVRLLVPASDSGPHRALLKEVGEREYWKRSGHSFYRMEHFDLEDMFGRRRRPLLRLDWRAERGNSRDHVHDWRLVLVLANDGRGLALFPLLEVDLPRPLRVFEYGMDGNRNHGLRWRPPVGQAPRHVFTGGVGDVVHPGVGLDVTQLVGMTLHAHRNAPWEHHPEEIVIAYRVAAQDAPVRADTLRFRVADEIERLKQGLLLGTPTDGGR